MKELVIFRMGDREQFFSFSLCGMYWAKKYANPASKWFGHVVGRLYFRKWWVPGVVGA